MLGTALLFSSNALAIEQIEIELGRLSGADWSLQEVTLHLAWNEDDSITLRLQGRELIHPSLAAPLASLQLECPQGEISGKSISCSDGKLTVDRSKAKSFSFPLELQATSVNGAWQLKLDAKAVDLRQLNRLLVASRGVQLKGRTDLSLQVMGSEAEGLAELHWQSHMRNISFSDSSGEYLGEELYGRWHGSVKHDGNSWIGNQKISLQRGAILTPAIFIAPEERPIDLKFGFDWAAENRKLSIRNLLYRHAGVVQAWLSATFYLRKNLRIQRVKLKTDKMDLPSVYGAYLQPVMAGTLLENLELAGEGVLELEMGSRGQHRVELQLNDLFMEDRDGGFAIYGLNGRLIATSGRAAESSRLSWEGGHLLEGISIGQSNTTLQLKDGGVELKAPLRLPVLDGSLRVDRFNMVDGKDGPKVRFQGSIAPISMQAISHALDWPPLAGELSGKIPAVSYEQGKIEVDGEMQIGLFEGDVTINNLYLEDLFGALPRAQADIELKNLDLETLTRTFSFGKITGRLQGYIHKLYLEAWRPVAFEARFETPLEDDSKHRISQKAVDNISNLGGVGVAGAISRTFMRMFKEFGYSRLGISCRLQHGVCAMGGIESAEQGYYLVRGGGIPRIDIIGFNQNIDWEILVTKLQDISQSPEPVIK